MKNPNKQKNWRRCLSCRHLADKKFFWRIVRVYQTHEVRLDQGMGRGAYLCPTKECLCLAQKNKRLAKALKTNIPPEIYKQLWQRIL